MVVLLLWRVERAQLFIILEPKGGRHITMDCMDGASR